MSSYFSQGSPPVLPRCRVVRLHPQSACGAVRAPGKRFRGLGGVAEKIQGRPNDFMLFMETFHGIYLWLIVVYLWLMWFIYG